MNNMCVLIVAYVTLSAHRETECSYPNNENFLYFVWYGSIIICFVTLILTIFYMIGTIDFCFNKIIPCG